MLTRIRVSIIGLAALALSTAQAHADNSPILIELFTSQSCSSCPPADVILSKLAQRPDVLPLSFHVDYWDNLGWKDPFSSHLNTTRQAAYRDSFHNAQIYTPQMVIGGLSEVVGSNGPAVAAAISDASRRQVPGPEINVQRGDRVTVIVAAARNVSPATIWIAAYDPHHETSVRNGENGGRTLVNTNVVRKLALLGSYSGAATTLSAPLDFAQEEEGIAVWLQKDSAGAILSTANAPPRSGRQP